MATKKKYKEFIVKQSSKEDKTGISPVAILANPKERKILQNGDSTPLEKIGAMILGKMLVEDIDAYVENFEAQLKATPMEDIIKVLVDGGYIEPDEIPVITVQRTESGILKSYSKVLAPLTGVSLNEAGWKDFKDNAEEIDKLNEMPEDYKIMTVPSSFSRLMTDLIAVGNLDSSDIDAVPGKYKGLIKDLIEIQKTDPEEIKVGLKPKKFFTDLASKDMVDPKYKDNLFVEENKGSKLNSKK